MSAGRRPVGARFPSPPAAAHRAAQFLNLSGWRATTERVERPDRPQGYPVTVVTLRATRTVERVALEVTAAWEWLASQRRWAAQTNQDSSVVAVRADGTLIAAHTALIALDHLAGLAESELAAVAKAAAAEATVR